MNDKEKYELLISKQVEKLEGISGLSQALSNYLKGTNQDSISKFLNFLTAEQVEPFVNKIIKVYTSKKDIFDKLITANRSLTCPDTTFRNEEINYRLLLLYSLFADREHKTDIMQTIKYDNPGRFLRILTSFKRASFFLSEKKYNTYIRAKKTIGEYEKYYDFPDNRTQFVTTKEAADSVIKKMNEQKTLDKKCECFEKEMGYPKDYFKINQPIYRIDLNGDEINHASKHLKEGISGISMYLPSGCEQGVNELWIPGGFTSGGQTPEIIVDSVPNRSPYVVGVRKYMIEGKNIVEKKVTEPR